MLEINVNVKCPDLVLAANTIASVFARTQQTENAAPNNPVEIPAAAPVPSQNAIPAPAPMTTPATPAPAAEPQTSAVPGAATPTLEQISRAGAALATAGKMGDLMAVVAKHGVQALTQLKPEQYAAVAADLRALGAQI